MMPPSALPRWLRLKPVAIRWSSVALGSRSPASCSTVNWSNGMFVLKASITQSRHRHIEPLAVGLVAVGVGVAGRVEPRAGHPLAVARRREQPVDDLLVGVRRLCRRGTASTSAGRRRQAGQVERHRRMSVARSASGEGSKALCVRAARARSDRSAFFGPGRVVDGGQCADGLGGMNAQCFCHLAPCSIHSPKQARSRLASACQTGSTPAAFACGVGGGNPPDQLALRGIAGHDGHVTAEVGWPPPRSRSGASSTGAPGTVAGVALVRENRPDVAIELDGPGGSGVPWAFLAAGA